MVSHNPFKRFYLHLYKWNMRRIFNRNHQKTMIVDDIVYTGSMNISQRYTTRKYGTRSFRDLSMRTRHSDEKYGAKQFFLDALLSNKKFHEDFDDEKAKKEFKEVDEIYRKIDEERQIEKEGSITFQREEPPKMSEIQDSLLEAVKGAKESIRIIQPYVTNITNFEEALKDASRRGVDVEFITARKRD